MKTFLVLMFFLLVQPNPSAEIDKKTYTIDTGHTFVTFEVRRFDMLDVVSTFRDISGTITLDPDNIHETEATITIKTASLESGNPRRDNAVKSPNFLHTEEFPEITFNSKRLKKSGQHWIAEGELTIRGVTRSVDLPVRITGPQKDPTGLTAVAIKGEITINRQDFGIPFNRKLPNGADFIGNEVNIEINALAIEE